MVKITKITIEKLLRENMNIQITEKNGIPYVILTKPNRHEMKLIQLERLHRKIRSIQEDIWMKTIITIEIISDEISPNSYQINEIRDVIEKFLDDSHISFESMSVKGDLMEDI